MEKTKKTNLWIFNHYAVTPDIPGGTRHYDLGRELMKRDYRITIFASSFPHKLRKELKLSKGENWKVENVDGVNFVWIRTFPYKKNDWRRMVNMLNYTYQAYWMGRKITKINQDIKRPDVIIGSSIHPFAVLAAYWLSKHYKTKFIMEVRDLWPQSLVDMGKISEKSSFAKTLRWLEQFLFKRADKIITLSPMTSDYLKRFGLLQEKSCLIPNGVNARLFEKTGALLGVSNGFTVLYLGSHASVNNLDVLLDAAKIIKDRSLNDIKFILVGDGSEKPCLIMRKEELGLDNLEFRDSVPKKEVPQTLIKADALVLIENKVLYGSSNKLQEYMASGRPIIFSSFAEHNLVREARCGLSASAGSSGELARVIINLYQMPLIERKKMGERGREYVKKHNDFSVLSERLDRCIKELCYK